jgi:hypothetical protein
LNTVSNRWFALHTGTTGTTHTLKEKNMFHALWSVKTKKYLDESILVVKKRVENVFLKISKEGRYCYSSSISPE